MGTPENFIFYMFTGMMLFMVLNEGIKIGKRLGTAWIDQKVVDRLCSSKLRASLIVHAVFAFMVLFMANIEGLSTQSLLVGFFDPDEMFFGLMFLGMGVVLMVMSRSQFTIKEDLSDHVSDIQEAPVSWFQKAYFSPLLGLMGVVIIGMVFPLLGLALVALSFRDALRSSGVIKGDFINALTFELEDGAEDQGDDGSEETFQPGLEAIGDVKVRRPALWPFFRRALNLSEYILVGGAVIMAIIVKMELTIDLDGPASTVLLILTGSLMVIGYVIALGRIKRFPECLTDEELPDVEFQLSVVEGFLDELWLVMGAVILVICFNPLFGAVALMALFGLIWYKLLYLEPRVLVALNSLPPEKLLFNFDALRRKAAMAELEWEKLLAPGEFERVELIMGRRAAQALAMEGRMRKHRERLSGQSGDSIPETSS